MHKKMSRAGAISAIVAIGTIVAIGALIVFADAGGTGGDIFYILE